MTTVQITGPEKLPLIGTKASYTVEIKKAWGDEWVPEKYLVPRNATHTVSPGTSRAEFVYSFGTIKREDDTTKSYYDYVITYLGQYIRIIMHRNEMDPVVLWTGVIAEESRNLQGTKFDWDADVADESGDQFLVAYGMEYILDRISVRGAWCETSSGESNIGWTPTFNRRARIGGSLRGNRSNAMQSHGFYAFSDDDSVWSNWDIAGYMLYHYGPDYDGGTPIFVMGGQSSALDHISDTYSLEGLTLKQVFDKLISRRRGLGWCVRVTEATEDLPSYAVIHVYSIFSDTIKIPNADDTEVWGNEDTVNFFFGESVNIDDVVIKYADNIRYDNILVQGEKLRTCFTAQAGTGENGQSAVLEQGWTTAEENAYKSVSGATNEEKDAERATDKYARVYQALRLPDDWNCVAYYGSHLSLMASAFPHVRNDGTLVAHQKQDTFHSQRRLLRNLLWKKPAAVSDAEPEFALPFAAFKTEINGTDQFIHADALASISKGASCTLRMMDKEFGVWLIAPGRVNHRLGLNHFDPDTYDTNFQPLIDWTTTYITVCCETDERAHVKILLPNNNRPSDDYERTLTLDVPNAHMWWVTPGTVMDVEDGELKEYDGTGYYNGEAKTGWGLIRDDTPVLREIAHFAAAWYGTQRASAQVSIRGVDVYAMVGQLMEMLTNGLNANDIHTPVTQVGYDFEAETTMIQTAYTELDVMSFFDLPGMSDARSVGREFRHLQHDISELQDHVGQIPSRIPTGTGGVMEIEVGEGSGVVPTAIVNSVTDVDGDAADIIVTADLGGSIGEVAGWNGDGYIIMP